MTTGLPANTARVYATATTPKGANIDTVERYLAEEVGKAAREKGLIRFDRLTPGKDGYVDGFPGWRATMTVVKPAGEPSADPFDGPVKNQNRSGKGPRQAILDEIMSDTAHFILAERQLLSQYLMSPEPPRPPARPGAAVPEGPSAGQLLKEVLDYTEDLKRKLVEGSTGQFVVDIVLAKLHEMVAKAAQ